MRKVMFVFFVLGTLYSFGQKETAYENPLDQMVLEVNQDSIENYMRKLESFGSRYTYAENRKEVALWIKGKFESFGYQDVFLDSLISTPYGGGEEKMIYNVICRSENIHNYPDYGMIGAHHDATTRYSQTVMDTAPGADDNASGTAGVLEIARVMKQNYDAVLPLHFATWTGEETGILGSNSYVDRYQRMDSLPVFYINLDMIANQTSANSQMNYYYDDVFSHTYQYIEQYTDIVIHHLEPSAAAGDNWPFDDAQVPFVYFQEYDFSEEYHKLSDVVDNLEMPFARKMVQGALAVTYNICGAFPDTEFTDFTYIGNGTDFTVCWKPADNAAYYHVNVYQDELLLTSINTLEDSLYISDMPLNSEVRITLQQTNNDSINGLLHSKIIRLNDQPPVYEMSSSMELRTVSIEWDGVLHRDLTEFVLQRRLVNTEEWETVSSFDLAVKEFAVENHPKGIWEYVLLVKDSQGKETLSETCIVYATDTKKDIMVVSGQLGGYGNPTHPDVLSFYENIMPQKDYHLFAAAIDHKYLPIINNMEVVIWNAFSSNQSEFHENIDLLKPYIENGGKLLLFAKNPQLHFDANYVSGGYNLDSWAVDLGINAIVQNDGARLKQILHPSGVSAKVDPEKLSSSFNGSIPFIDVFDLNDNVEVMLNYQSLIESDPVNNFDDQPIAFKYQNGDGVIIACGAPLYYFMENEAELLLQKLLEDDMMVGDQMQRISDGETSIYPTPADDFINITLDKKVKFSGTCSIYDISGKIVLRKDVSVLAGQKFKIDVRSLNSGVYMLQLKGADIYNSKFILE